MGLTRRCAEGGLTRNLGVGMYESGVLGLEMQAAVFEMLTYDNARGAPRNLELSIEISRWGDPGKDDARYLRQPYYVAANVHRFNEPAETLAEVAP